MYLEQEIKKIQELLLNSDTKLLCWKQMKLGLEIAQVEIGVESLIYNSNYKQLSVLLEDTYPNGNLYLSTLSKSSIGRIPPHLYVKEINPLCPPSQQMEYLQLV